MCWSLLDWLLIVGGVFVVGVSVVLFVDRKAKK
jgi:hypothetical protein